MEETAVLLLHFLRCLYLFPLRSIFLILLIAILHSTFTPVSRNLFAKNDKKCCYYLQIVAKMILIDSDAACISN